MLTRHHLAEVFLDEIYGYGGWAPCGVQWNENQNGTPLMDDLSAVVNVRDGQSTAQDTPS